MSVTRIRTRGASRKCIEASFPVVQGLGALASVPHPDAALLAACARLEDYRDRFDAAKRLKGRGRKAALAAWNWEGVKELEHQVGRLSAHTVIGLIAKGEAALRDFYEGADFFCLTKAFLQEMLCDLRDIEPLREAAGGEA